MQGEITNSSQSFAMYLGLELKFVVTKDILQQ